MVALPLAHISWAVSDNHLRKACDAWIIDTFGAETAYEILITPENENQGLDREEKLMLIGDTMLIPIAPAGQGLLPESPTGEMLRRNAGPNRWLGLALKVADIAGAAAWFQSKGFVLHYDPGMEAIYFLIGRKQAMGVRLEILCHPLPNDPREQPGWNPMRWRDDHPLGIEGLQAIAVSAPSAEAARDLFGSRLELPELGARAMPQERAQCLAFDLGDTVIEALVPDDADSAIARHLASTQGICGITFKVKNALAAADWLRGRGHELIGDVAGRFAIHPDEAHGRMIWFTGSAVGGYPPMGSRLSQPARF